MKGQNQEISLEQKEKQPLFHTDGKVGGKDGIGISLYV